jgi:hypothetical protein
MAATGLLSSNPYGKAVALDFSTKAVSTGIQLLQKEQAKKESLDRYFKDYEKSINSAGMREQDQNVFLDQMNDAKLYYLQNQERILMPSKYGAQYQSEYLGKLKNAQTLINESKQEAANTKIDADHYYQAIVQGLDVPDGYMEARRRADLPLGNPEHQKIDPFKWNFTKGFNEDDFVKSITRGLQSDETIIGQVPDNKGKILTTISYDYSDPSKQALATRAAMMYGTVPGVTNQINKLIKSGEYLKFKKQFQDLFPGDDIENALPQQVAAAVGLGLTGHGKIVTKNQPDEVWLKAEALKNSLKIAAAGKSNIIVNTGGGDTGTNAPAPASVIEEVIKLNKNYAKKTTTANLYDVTDNLGAYTTKKLGKIDMIPNKVLYNANTNKFIIQFPADYSEPDQILSGDNYKVLIDKYNPGAKSQKFNGPIKK